MSIRYTLSTFDCRTRVEPFVTIWSDLRGRLTAFRSASDDAGLAIAKGRYESVVQQSIQSMLDETLGPNRAVARVSTNREKNVRGDSSDMVIHTSVVVLVNSAPQNAGNPPLGGAGSSQLTPANIQLIRNAVIAAADLNVAQGDEVSVQLAPFRRNLLPMTAGIDVPVWILTVLGGVAVLGTLALLVLRVRSSLHHESAKPAAPAEESIAPSAIPATVPVTREHMIEYVAGVARENPESIAKLVKLWLTQ
jgi:flagellar biosynthesis/type III secretory pathway M-ring protein FliF/YscJ